MYKIIGADQKEYGPIDAGQLRQWIAQGRLHGQSLIRPDGAAQWQPLNSLPEFISLVPPPIVPLASEPADSLATIIPYKNVPALMAYYLGVFSVIPMVGVVLGIAAVILGVMGLRRAREHPEAKGRVHAWIGIIVGGLFGLLYLVLVGLMIFAMISEGRSHNR